MRRSLAAAVVAVVAVTALVAACTRPVAGPKSVDERPPADFPERHYARAIARGAPVYRVDPTRSRAIVEVHRGGAGSEGRSRRVFTNRYSPDTERLWRSPS